MDDRADLAGMLLSAAAGLLEDASAVAAMAATATQIDQIAALQRSLDDAGRLIAAAKVLAASSSGDQS